MQKYNLNENSLRNKRRLRSNRAQATIEFALAFIVLVLIFYSCVKALEWLGHVLPSPVEQHYSGLYGYSGTTNPEQFWAYSNAVAQLDNIQTSLPPLKLVYPGHVFSNQ